MDQNINHVLWKNKGNTMINKITNFFVEKYKLSLEIKQNSNDFELFIKSRFDCSQKISQQWLSNNRNLFKIKYQHMIDKILQNMHPIFEPKAISIDLEKTTVKCVNYLYDETTIKLTKLNAKQLNLNHDLV